MPRQRAGQRPNARRGGHRCHIRRPS
jgi:hypothetical protein